MKLSVYLLLALIIGTSPRCHEAFADNSTVDAKTGQEKGQQEITITADRLFADSKANSAEFVGNVKAIQGDTIITARQLKIFYRPKGEASQGEPSQKKVGPSQSIEKIVASGNVVIEFDNRVAKSDLAVYTTKDKQLVLSGENSEVLSGSDWIRGNKITLNRFDEKVAVEGGAGKQVKVLFRPKGDGLN